MKGILTDDNGNLMVQNGRLVVGENSEQVAHHLIIAHPGEYKHAPMLGGNIRRMIAGNPDPFWVGKMKSQLRQALVKVSSLKVVDKDIVLEIK